MSDVLLMIVVSFICDSIPLHVFFSTLFYSIFSYPTHFISYTVLFYYAILYGTKLWLAAKMSYVMVPRHDRCEIAHEYSVS